jgi:hypothetical protein
MQKNPIAIYLENTINHGYGRTWTHWCQLKAEAVAVSSFSAIPARSSKLLAHSASPLKWTKLDLSLGILYNLSKVIRDLVLSQK